MHFVMDDPYAHQTRLTSFMVTVFALCKTFYFMRVIEGFSYLVKMLEQVVKDLRGFLIFYMILMWTANVALAIIQLGNFEGDERMRLYRGGKQAFRPLNYPGLEYQHMPKFLRQLIGSIRISLADFDYDESTHLHPTENYMYWGVWLTIVLMTNIVFLNFIIAEVSASYNKVRDKLEGLEGQERMNLIKESEVMLDVRVIKQNKKMFPKYLISREIDN